MHLLKKAAALTALSAATVVPAASAFTALTASATSAHGNHIVIDTTEQRSDNWPA